MGRIESRGNQRGIVKVSGKTPQNLGLREGERIKGKLSKRKKEKNRFSQATPMAHDGNRFRGKKKVQWVCNTNQKSTKPI